MGFGPVEIAIGGVVNVSLVIKKWNDKYGKSLCCSPYSDKAMGPGLVSELFPPCLMQMVLLSNSWLKGLLWEHNSTSGR